MKYKDKRTTPDRSDIEQAVTYGVAYNCPQVLVAMPKSAGGITGWRELGRVGGISVHAYFFDLDAPDLFQEEREFVDTIQSL